MAKKHTGATIIEWLRSHELITLSALERKCDIPAGVVSKSVKGATHQGTGENWSISEKHIDKLVFELKKYGYK